MLRAMMESRPWGANRYERPRRASRVIGFTTRWVEPDRHQLVRRSSLQVGDQDTARGCGEGEARNSAPLLHTDHAMRASLFARATDPLL